MTCSYAPNGTSGIKDQKKLHGAEVRRAEKRDKKKKRAAKRRTKQRRWT